MECAIKYMPSMIETMPMIPCGSPLDGVLLHVSFLNFCHVLVVVLKEESFVRRPLVALVMSSFIHFQYNITCSSICAAFAIFILLNCTVIYYKLPGAAGSVSHFRYIESYHIIIHILHIALYTNCIT